MGQRDAADENLQGQHAGADAADAEAPPGLGGVGLLVAAYTEEWAADTGFDQHSLETLGAALPAGTSALVVTTDQAFVESLRDGHAQADRVVTAAQMGVHSASLHGSSLTWCGTCRGGAPCLG